jgi:hypothetical protein
MMKGIYPRPSAIEVGRWQPLGAAVSAFTGGPALFGKWVVTAAGERQVVDVGGVAFGVGRAVVDCGVIARDVTAGV